LKEDEAPLVSIIFDLYAGRSRHQRSNGVARPVDAG